MDTLSSIVVGVQDETSFLLRVVRGQVSHVNFRVRISSFLIALSISIDRSLLNAYYIYGIKVEGSYFWGAVTDTVAFLLVKIPFREKAVLCQLLMKFFHKISFVKLVHYFFPWQAHKQILKA